jgi:undecaprenyl-diphosphatase
MRSARRAGISLAPMTWWEATILGLIQGLTEFLPISSSAHIRVFGPLLPHGADPGAAFTAIIQIGTEAAVLLYFRHDIARIIAAWWRALIGRDGSDGRSRMGAHNPDARMGWFVILGSIPIVVLGVLFKDQIESALRNLYITAAVLAIFALVLWWADRVGAKRRELTELRARDAVALGLAQAAALVPGVSRSGGTISMGLFLGLTREAAARYSFLLAIPAVLGSGFFELATSYDTLTAPGGPGLAATVIAAVVAFAVGYVVIVWFLRLITHHSFLPFVIYRIVFAGVIVAMLATGVIAAT